MYMIQEAPKLIVQAADDDYAQARQCSKWKISWIAEANKLRHGDFMKVQLPMAAASCRGKFSFRMDRSIPSTRVIAQIGLFQPIDQRSGLPREILLGPLMILTSPV
jgi:hypothetical protein